MNFVYMMPWAGILTYSVCPCLTRCNPGIGYGFTTSLTSIKWVTVDK